VAPPYKALVTIIATKNRIKNILPIVAPFSWAVPTPDPPTLAKSYNGNLSH